MGRKALIKSRKRHLASLAVLAAASASTGLFALAPAAVADNGIAGRSYQQNNIVSDIPGRAVHTDPNLRNSWGTSTGAVLPIWVSDNATGEATLYDGQGNPQPGPGNWSCPYRPRYRPAPARWGRPTGPSSTRRQVDL